MRTINLSDAEYEQLVTTIEGAIEEFEELERTVDYFVSLTPERLVEVLDIVKRSDEP